MPDEQPETLRRRVAELEAALDALRESHRVEREHDRLRHQEHALGLVIEAEAARDRNHLLAKRVKRMRERLEESARRARRRERDLRAELEAVYASRTWRVGQRIAHAARSRGR